MGKTKLVALAAGLTESVLSESISPLAVRPEIVPPMVCVVGAVGGGFSVIVAALDVVLSAMLVAVSVTVVAELTTDGAV